MRQNSQQGEYLLHIVTNEGETDKPLVMDVKLFDVYPQIELDTGSAVSTMSEHLLLKLFRNVSLAKGDLN